MQAINNTSNAINALVALGGKHAKEAALNVAAAAVEYLSAQVLLHGNGDAAKAFDAPHITRQVKGFALAARDAALSARAASKAAGELAKNGQLAGEHHARAEGMAAQLAADFKAAILAARQAASDKRAANAQAKKEAPAAPAAAPSSGIYWEVAALSAIIDALKHGGIELTEATPAPVKVRKVSRKTA